jgi:hypothetical protein
MDGGEREVTKVGDKESVAPQPETAAKKGKGRQAKGASGEAKTKGEDTQHDIEVEDASVEEKAELEETGTPAPEKLGHQEPTRDKTETQTTAEPTKKADARVEATPKKKKGLAGISRIPIRRR